MKKIFKVLKVILFTVAIFILTIFAIRTINGVRYPSEGDFVLTDEYIIHQKDLSQYPVSDEFGGVKIIDNNRAQGFHMIPSEKTSKGIVIVFGGSEGSSSYENAYEIYSRGYEVLSLYFFGQKNQTENLSKVDISFFEDVEDYIEKEHIDSSPMTIKGASKGAELGLVLTQYYNIDNLVLYTPSTYVFQGLDMSEPASSWIYDGSELPYGSFDKMSAKGMRDMFGAMILNYPISFRETYKSVVKDLTLNDDRWIYKKPIDGNILIFAGDDDQMWNADEMGETLKNEYPEQVEFHLYKDAGHIFEAVTHASGMAVGGNKEANVNAKIESDKILFERLAEWHK